MGCHSFIDILFKLKFSLRVFRIVKGCLKMSELFITKTKKCFPSLGISDDPIIYCEEPDTNLENKLFFRLTIKLFLKFEKHFKPRRRENLLMFWKAKQVKFQLNKKH